MAIIAPGSRRSRTNWIITAALCGGMGLWFAYDGWLNKKYQEKETIDGKMTPNLVFNRYIPFPLGLYVLYCFFAATRVKTKRIVLDEKGLCLENQTPIPIEHISYIDNRYFKEDGVFIVGSTNDGKTKKIKITDRKYDNLAELLEELIKQTGAAPADPDDPPSKA